MQVINTYLICSAKKYKAFFKQTELELYIGVKLINSVVAQVLS